MNKDAQKNMMFLVIAAIVLVAVNAVVWLGAKSGRLAPIDNVPLWGIFVVLNTFSLLWAISLLGLQPMVVALSYLAGAFLAYQGVKLVPEVNIAEVITSGATYGAFGALVVGNAGAKVRLAFFQKGQVPFVFIIAALLIVDAFLNSSISNAGWNVILNALVFPFVLAGVVVGLLWVVLASFGVGSGVRATPAATVEHAMRPLDEEFPEVTAKLMFQVPARGEPVEEEPEQIAAMMELDERETATMEMVASTEVEPPCEEASAVEAAPHDHFFPLEIDKDDDFILPMDDSGMTSLAALVVEGSFDIGEGPVYFSSIVEEPPVAKPVSIEPAIQTVEVLASEPEPKPKKSSDDWLSGHLELLKKINK